MPATVPVNPPAWPHRQFTSVPLPQRGAHQRTHRTAQGSHTRMASINSTSNRIATKPHPRLRDQQGDAATYLPRARRGPARPDRSPRCAPRPAAASALDPDPARPHLRNRPRGEPRPRRHRRRRRAGGRRWRAAAAARRSSPLLRVQWSGVFA